MSRDRSLEKKEKFGFFRGGYGKVAKENNLFPHNPKGEGARRADEGVFECLSPSPNPLPRGRGLFGIGFILLELLVVLGRRRRGFFRVRILFRGAGMGNGFSVPLKAN